MVQALVEIDENTNRVLNVIKAKYDLRGKGDAIEFVVNEYIAKEEEPELRPEFIKKMRRIEKQRPIRIGTIENLRKRYEK